MIQRGKKADWASEPKNEAHSVLCRVFRTIAQNEGWRRDADEYHGALYAGGEAAAGIRGTIGADQYDPTRLPYNIARKVVDTLLAKVVKHRPLPIVLSSRGDWNQQKRAQKMTQFIEGGFYLLKIFERQSEQIIRDALVFGRGILYLSNDEKDLYCERARPWDVFVDPWDARYGEPRCMYRVRSVDRGVLKAQLAETYEGETPLDDLLDTASTFDELNADPTEEIESTVDRVHVLEAWRLPDRKGEKGRHILTLTSGSLLDEDYEDDSFPFAILNYSAPLSGLWGTGIVQQIEGFQYQTNLMSEKIADAHASIAAAMILVDTSSDIVDNHITDGVNIIRHKPGHKPEVYSPTPIAPQAYQWLDTLQSDALGQAGLSQMSTESKKPAGVDSGIALQTLDDVETDRFTPFGRGFEAWCLNVARLILRTASRIAEQHGEMSVSVPMNKGILKLKWADAKIDGYELKVFNSSVLPQQPAARLERLMTLFNTGIVDRAVLLRELDSSDLQAELDLETADKLNVDERIQIMLDAEPSELEEKYYPPTPYIDLAWAARRAQQRLNRAEIDGCPEGNLDLLRRYISDCEQMKKFATGQTGQEATAMGEQALPGMAPPEPQQPAPPA